jgi:hypothetical protein
MNWITPPNPTCNLVSVLGKSFAERELRWPGSFPDLRRDSNLAIACDYSGEHAQSAFIVLNFLLVDRPGIMSRWEGDRLAIRNEHFSDGRRHAFKKLGDAQRQKALLPFLKASSNLNGVLMSVSIHKSIQDYRFGFSFGFEETIDLPKPKVFAKMIQIALFGSILISGLSAPDQTLHWITDNDEIVSNAEAQHVFGRVSDAVFRSVCPHRFSDVSIGIAGLFDDGRRAEDLCSIPDLAGGAIADSLISLDEHAIPRSTCLTTPFPSVMPTKTDIILTWLGLLEQGDQNLKHLNFMIRPTDNDQMLISHSNVVLSVEEGVNQRIWTPPDKGWKRAYPNLWT